MPRKRGGEIHLYKDQSPCLNCPKRWRTDSQSCHDTCDEYKKYRRKRDEDGENRRRQNEQKNEFYGYLSGKKDTPAR